MQSNPLRQAVTAALATTTLLAATTAGAASHREAPFITTQPKVDATDFYMFQSYGTTPTPDSYTTLIANYQPLQAPYGGPNYFTLDDQAIYEIHIDNDGDAREDLTFRFDFETVRQDLTVPAGGENVEVPLKNIGGIGPDADVTGAVNVRQTYTVDVVSGDRRTGTVQSITNVMGGSDTFRKPVDNIGDKTFADGGGGSHYEAYANNHIHEISIPGCSTSGRVFVGQRQEGFVVNLGEVFDLINTDPLGARDAEANVIGNTNVSSLALEVPTDCLTAGSEAVVGGWTTASKRQARVLNPAPQANGKGATVEGGAWTQVSRLGMPLVNEVVIGLKDKDRFNASEPKDDGQFLTYVTNPTLPELVEILHPATAPAPSRDDLVAAFLTGVNGLNQPSGVTASEMLRLNTGIAPTAPANQEDLGVLDCDLAGFPNGRRPVDDVVDVALTVAMGSLTANNPNGLQFCDTSTMMVQNPGGVVTDGARASGPTATTSFAGGGSTGAVTYLGEFPYLNTPLAGSPAN